jgi:hypothetical protein
MDMNTSTDTTNPRRGAIWWLFRLFLVLCGLLVAAAIFVPSPIENRQRKNEVASAVKLRSIHDLQEQYAAAHPKIGFACELPRLKLSERVKDSGYDPQEFLVSGTQFGYRFAIFNCRSGPTGVVDHYDVVAEPVEPGKSGSRAFCSNESGVLWYDDDGRPSNCLVNRQPIK